MPLFADRFITHASFDATGGFALDLATRQPQLIDTGYAIRLNNDHVLSFDGSMLGLSDQSQASGGRSTVRPA